MPVSVCSSPFMLMCKVSVRHYAMSLSLCNGGSLPVCKVAVIVQRLCQCIFVNLCQCTFVSLFQCTLASLCTFVSLCQCTQCALFRTALFKNGGERGVNKTLRYLSLSNTLYGFVFLCREKVHSHVQRPSFR